MPAFKLSKTLNKIPFTMYFYLTIFWYQKGSPVMSSTARYWRTFFKTRTLLLLLHAIFYRFLLKQQCLLLIVGYEK